jgi:hypothetical protein
VGAGLCQRSPFLLPSSLSHPLTSFFPLFLQGDFDLERVPAPPFHPLEATLPPAGGRRPSQLPPSLFPPYSPQEGPSEPLRQRTVDKLEMYATRPEPLSPSRSSTPPSRPRKSSKRPLNPPPLPSPPAKAYLPSPPLTPPEVIVGGSPPATSPTKRPPLVLPTPSTSSIAAPTLNSLNSCRSLIQHPLCRDIVAECLQNFETNAAILTVFDEEKLVFLASSDVEQDPKSIPKQASFCSHTVLNGDRGFVVLNAATDWRCVPFSPLPLILSPFLPFPPSFFTPASIFSILTYSFLRFANNCLVVEGGVRFYAGMPIFASTDLRNSSAEKVAIGTLCVTDPAPREGFSAGERAELYVELSLLQMRGDTWRKKRRTRH